MRYYFKDHSTPCRNLPDQIAPERRDLGKDRDALLEFTTSQPSMEALPNDEPH